MEDIFLRQCRESRYRNQRKSDGRGRRFSNPFIGFYEGRTYRQPEVVFISLPQAATGLCCACRARSVGGAFSRTCSCRRRHSSPEGHIPCRLLCAVHPYAEGVPANFLFYSREGKVRMMQMYLHHPSAPAGSNTPPLWGEQTKEKLSHAPLLCCGVFDF